MKLFRKRISTVVLSSKLLLALISGLPICTIQQIHAGVPFDLGQIKKNIIRGERLDIAQLELAIAKINESSNPEAEIEYLPILNKIYDFAQANDLTKQELEKIQLAFQTAIDINAAKDSRCSSKNLYPFYKNINDLKSKKLSIDAKIKIKETATSRPTPRPVATSANTTSSNLTPTQPLAYNPGQIQVPAHTTQVPTNIPVSLPQPLTANQTNTGNGVIFDFINFPTHKPAQISTPTATVTTSVNSIPSITPAVQVANPEKAKPMQPLTPNTNLINTVNSTNDNTPVVTNLPKAATVSSASTSSTSTSTPSGALSTPTKVALGAGALAALATGAVLATNKLLSSGQTAATTPSTSMSSTASTSSIAPSTSSPSLSSSSAASSTSTTNTSNTSAVTSAVTSASTSSISSITSATSSPTLSSSSAASSTSTTNTPNTSASTSSTTSSNSNSPANPTPGKTLLVDVVTSNNTLDGKPTNSVATSTPANSTTSSSSTSSTVTNNTQASTPAQTSMSSAASTSSITSANPTPGKTLLVDDVTSKKTLEEKPTNSVATSTPANSTTSSSSTSTAVTNNTQASATAQTSTSSASTSSASTNSTIEFVTLSTSSCNFPAEITLQPANPTPAQVFLNEPTNIPGLEQFIETIKDENDAVYFMFLDKCISKKDEIKMEQERKNTQNPELIKLQTIIDSELNKLNNNTDKYLVKRLTALGAPIGLYANADDHMSLFIEEIMASLKSLTDNKELNPTDPTLNTMLKQIIATWMNNPKLISRIQNKQAVAFIPEEESKFARIMKFVIPALAVGGTVTGIAYNAMNTAKPENSTCSNYNIPSTVTGPNECNSLSFTQPTTIQQTCFANSTIATNNESCRAPSFQQAVAENVQPMSPAIFQEIPLGLPSSSTSTSSQPTTVTAPTITNGICQNPHYNATGVCPNTNFQSTPQQVTTQAQGTGTLINVLGTINHIAMGCGEKKWYNPLTWGKKDASWTCGETK